MVKNNTSNEPDLSVILDQAFLTELEEHTKRAYEEIRHALERVAYDPVVLSALSRAQTATFANLSMLRAHNDSYGRATQKDVHKAMDALYERIDRMLES